MTETLLAGERTEIAFPGIELNALHTRIMRGDVRALTRLHALALNENDLIDHGILATRDADSALRRVRARMLPGAEEAMPEQRDERDDELLAYADAMRTGTMKLVEAIEETRHGAKYLLARLEKLERRFDGHMEDVANRGVH